jgi:hypothetical protein
MSNHLAAAAPAAARGVAVSLELLRLIETHRLAWDAFAKPGDSDAEEVEAEAAEYAAATALCAYRCRTIEEVRVKAAYLRRYPGLAELGDTELIAALLQSFCEEGA